MDRAPKRNNKLGWVWVVLSPLLFIMASISTVQSPTTYYVQLACFSVLAITGIVFGIAYVLGQTFAGKVLSGLSWIACIYLTGAGVLCAAIALLGPTENSFTDTILLIGVGLIISAQGIPFFFLAKKYGKTA